MVNLGSRFIAVASIVAALSGCYADAATKHQPPPVFQVSAGCFPHHELRAVAEGPPYNQRSVWWGRITEDRALELMVAEDGMWSLFEVYSDGSSCLLRHGKEWGGAVTVPGAPT